jgi:hypothetical protein
VRRAADRVAQAVLALGVAPTEVAAVGLVALTGADAGGAPEVVAGVYGVMMLSRARRSRRPSGGASRAAGAGERTRGRGRLRP